MLERRLAILVGKGGVGRTTVAAALAVLGARRGMRVLLCEIHGRDRATRLLGHAPIGAEQREVRPGLVVANVTPAAALEEYLVSVVRSRRVYRRLFDRPTVQAFTRAVPGLDDLMMIGKVRFHAEDPRWDLVVVDAPATGNGVFFLELPDVVSRVARGGPLAYYARKQRDLLRDRARTAVHIVTLAEEMPVVESLELARVLRDDLGLPLGAVVVNRVRPRPFQASAEELLARVSDTKDALLAPLVAAGRWSLGRWRLQEEHLGSLRARVSRPLFLLPELGEAEVVPATLDRLVDALAAQLDGQLRERAPNR